MNNETLKLLENDLIDDGFDTILFTKIIGVEDRIAYKKNMVVMTKHIEDLKKII